MSATTYTVRGTIVRVIDGDTFVADVDQGWHTWRMHSDKDGTGHVRVLGIDAPEMHGDEKPAGEAAKAYAETLLPVGTAVWLRSRELVTDRADDNFGRMLADVELPDGRDYATVMLNAGQAVVYDG